MTKWFRSPISQGIWWYWLLGSGIVRQQVVYCFDRKFFINNDGLMLAKKTARLWHKGDRKPALPPKRLREELKKKHCR